MENDKVILLLSVVVLMCAFYGYTVEQRILQVREEFINEEIQHENKMKNLKEDLTSIKDQLRAQRKEMDEIKHIFLEKDDACRKEMKEIKENIMLLLKDSDTFYEDTLYDVKKEIQDDIFIYSETTNDNKQARVNAKREDDTKKRGSRVKQSDRMFFFGTIETWYNYDQGFQHIFKNNISKLKISHGDQLLDINGDDATLMPHQNVWNLISTLPLKEINTMIYWRPSIDKVTDLKFSLRFSGGTTIARFISSVTVDDSRPLMRTVYIYKQGKPIFMQHISDLPKEKIVFKQLIQPLPNKQPCNSGQCLFTEYRRLIDKNKDYRFFIRKYSTKFFFKETYLHVTGKGDFELVNDSRKASNFKLLPAQYNAFFVLNEISQDRCMALVGSIGKFVTVKYRPIDKIRDVFRFEIIKCQKKT